MAVSMLVPWQILSEKGTTERFHNNWALGPAHLGPGPFGPGPIWAPAYLGPGPFGPWSNG